MFIKMPHTTWFKVLCMVLIPAFLNIMFARDALALHYTPDSTMKDFFKNDLREVIQEGFKKLLWNIIQIILIILICIFQQWELLPVLVSSMAITWGVDAGSQLSISYGANAHAVQIIGAVIAAAIGGYMNPGQIGGTTLSAGQGAALGAVKGAALGEASYQMTEAGWSPWLVMAVTTAGSLSFDGLTGKWVSNSNKGGNATKPGYMKNPEGLMNADQIMASGDGGTGYAVEIGPDGQLSLTDANSMTNIEQAAALQSEPYIPDSIGGQISGLDQVAMPSETFNVSVPGGKNIAFSPDSSFSGSMPGDAVQVGPDGQLALAGPNSWSNLDQAIASLSPNSNGSQISGLEGVDTHGGRANGSSIQPERPVFGGLNSRGAIAVANADSYGGAVWAAIKSQGPGLIASYLARGTIYELTKDEDDPNKQLIYGALAGFAGNMAGRIFNNMDWLGEQYNKIGDPIKLDDYDTATKNQYFKDANGGIRVEKVDLNLPGADRNPFDDRYYNKPGEARGDYWTLSLGGSNTLGNDLLSSALSSTISAGVDYFFSKNFDNRWEHRMLGSSLAVLGSSFATASTAYLFRNDPQAGAEPMSFWGRDGAFFGNFAENFAMAGMGLVPIAGEDDAWTFAQKTTNLLGLNARLKDQPIGYDKDGNEIIKDIWLIDYYQHVTSVDFMSEYGVQHPASTWANMQFNGFVNRLSSAYQGQAAGNFSSESYKLMRNPLVRIEERDTIASTVGTYGQRLPFGEEVTPDLGLGYNLRGFEALNGQYNYYVTTWTGRPLAMLMPRMEIKETEVTKQEKQKAAVADINEHRGDVNYDAGAQMAALQADIDSLKAQKDELKSKLTGINTNSKLAFDKFDGMKEDLLAQYGQLGKEIAALEAQKQAFVVPEPSNYKAPIAVVATAKPTIKRELVPSGDYDLIRLDRNGNRIAVDFDGDKKKELSYNLSKQPAPTVKPSQPAVPLSINQAAPTGNPGMILSTTFQSTPTTSTASADPNSVNDGSTPAGVSMEMHVGSQGTPTLPKVTEIPIDHAHPKPGEEGLSPHIVSHINVE
ncbi:MAG: hypothetical protein KJ880_04650 [Candidatus Omnitrophica bacterium]|nr:hypothetical protein [Candidatus Omnitrophota bacterium]